MKDIYSLELEFGRNSYRFKCKELCGLFEIIIKYNDFWSFYVKQYFI